MGSGESWGNHRRTPRRRFLTEKVGIWRRQGRLATAVPPHPIAWNDPFQSSFESQRVIDAIWLYCVIGIPSGIG
jgi:hypothetical protein